MGIIDYSIVVGLLLLITVAALMTRRYTRSVADFLAANRCAGRYLISVSDGMASAGAISFIAWFEMIYLAGFITSWWIMVNVPLQLTLALAGWVIYRFRQTRALTLAQFFEQRYSKSFRVFAGIISFISGIINFGIFPAIGTQFFLYYCNLPASFEIAGLMVSTYVFVMFILLTVSLFFTFVGGQIAVIVTDFMQGTFCNIAFMILVGFLLWRIDFAVIIETLSQRPEGESMLNPFNTSNVKNFNVWYFAIAAVGIMYNYMGWQGNQAYNSSAKNAHEARMAKILGFARVGIAQHILVVLVPICGYVIMQSTVFESQAASATEVLNTITNEKTRLQMTVPVAIKQILPVGLIGVFCAVMMAAFIGACDTALHSWGSIFVQDIMLPFYKKPLSAKKHMLLLRVAIFLVAVFVFLFSLVFKQTQHLQMYFALTGAIFLGGSGSVIIGGLYWKKGTTAAAWSSMIVGSTLAVSGVVIHQKFPDCIINGQWMYFAAIVCSVITYIVVSLCTCKQDFNMDRLLHRGEYAVSQDRGLVYEGKIGKFMERLGITNEFSKRDKVVYLIIMGWAVSWFLLFIVGCIYNLTHKVSDVAWGKFWYLYVLLYFAVGIVIVVWLVVGGVLDMKKMIRVLSVVKRDVGDDGTVADNDKLPN